MKSNQAHQLIRLFLECLRKPVTRGARTQQTFVTNTTAICRVCEPDGKEIRSIQRRLQHQPKRNGLCRLVVQLPDLYLMKFQDITRMISLCITYDICTNWNTEPSGVSFHKAGSATRAGFNLNRWVPLLWSKSHLAGSACHKVVLQSTASFPCSRPIFAW